LHQVEIKSQTNKINQTMSNNSEITSPITDKILPTLLSQEEAKAKGHFVYDKPTIQNTVMLFIDHQIGLMAGVRDFQNLSTYKNNVLGLAKVAIAAKIPVLLSSSNAQWQNGDTLPELKALFPNEPIYRRTGIINAYEDPTFRNALLQLLKDKGRTHIIISGVTLGTCVCFPTLSLLNDGYKVYPVIDASGAWNQYEVTTTIARMTSAGAEPVTVFPLACELQADWKGETANDMFTPFKENLPEYAFLIQTYWDTAAGSGVKDPFK
jgi:nicotinamidase-related amidase